MRAASFRITLSSTRLRAQGIIQNTNANKFLFRFARTSWVRVQIGRPLVGDSDLVRTARIVPINFAAAIASLHHRYAFVGVLSRTPLDLPRIAVLLNQAHARPHGKQIPLAPGQLSFEQARRERCVDRSGWGPHGQCPVQRGQLQNG